jgi:hypothetical protein
VVEQGNQWTPPVGGGVVKVTVGCSLEKKAAKDDIAAHLPL